MITEGNINEVVHKITDYYNPEKVILFGSCVDGNLNANSDIDLILIKQTTEPKHLRSAAIYKQLLGIKIPIDILVYTPDEFAKEVLVNYSFLQDAIKHSKVVYER